MTVVNLEQFESDLISIEYKGKAYSIKKIPSRVTFKLLGNELFMKDVSTLGGKKNLEIAVLGVVNKHYDFILDCISLITRKILGDFAGPEWIDENITVKS